MEPDKPHTVNEPDIESGYYSYADSLTWEIPELVELIRGKVYKKSLTAPPRIHQSAVGQLTYRLYSYCIGKGLEVYNGPLDVRLPDTESKDDKDIFNVVQPDVLVVSDKSKLDDIGCMGAPDFVAEILTGKNHRLELIEKFNLYQDHHVKEYWVILPESQLVQKYTLVGNKYQSSQLLTSGDVVESAVIEGFKLDLEEFFGDVE
ncbi:MAG: Uma2 family endonuclease [Algoriphagus sp.]|uniref:Uma2 family endonuclease n=1 Tax=Algoriphagus sp. TaxID=1872435 RepID=UPI00273038A0|nr:Uma2 family endonuclease [Algoriphagus sp.]MDP2040335.1 Uma2 family endonuclease [Algoriphagus sp.]MDP3472972.1 Uma2 family endonuclease [Algoriphagus sp.]